MESLCRDVLLTYLFVCVGSGVRYRPHCCYLVLRCALMCSLQVHLLLSLWDLASQVHVWVFPYARHAHLGLQYLLPR